MSASSPRTITLLSVTVLAIVAGLAMTGAKPTGTTILPAPPNALALTPEDVRAFSIYFRLISSGGTVERQRAARAYVAYSLAAGCSSCQSRQTASPPGSQERLLAAAALFGQEVGKFDVAARQLKGNPPDTRESLNVRYTGTTRDQLVALQAKRDEFVKSFVAGLHERIGVEDAETVYTFVRTHVKSKIRIVQ